MTNNKQYTYDALVATAYKHRHYVRTMHAYKFGLKLYKEIMQRDDCSVQDAIIDNETTSHQFALDIAWDDLYYDSSYNGNL